MTFDDGPDPVPSALTPILKEVADRGVRAVFFVIGQEVVTNHSAITTIRNAGHVVGNHSWDHMMSGTRNYTDESIFTQFQRTHEEVKKAGVVMEYWRAPRGEQIARIAEILTAPKSGKPLYTKGHSDWQADSRDAKGARSGKDMLQSIQDDIDNKGIRPLRGDGGVPTRRLLFHVVPSTANVLKEVLDELERRGGKFVDFSQDS